MGLTLKFKVLLAEITLAMALRHLLFAGLYLRWGTKDSEATESCNRRLKSTSWEISWQSASRNVLRRVILDIPSVIEWATWIKMWKVPGRSVRSRIKRQASRLSDRSCSCTTILSAMSSTSWTDETFRNVTSPARRMVLKFSLETTKKTESSPRASYTAAISGNWCLMYDHVFATLDGLSKSWDFDGCTWTSACCRVSAVRLKIASK